MSHLRRFGPPDIRDTYSLLVSNMAFHDLFPLFSKYGKVIDIFFPKDRRSGGPRGYGFVRYKSKEEAQMAVKNLSGRIVNGREIAVKFVKYGPKNEPMSVGDFPKTWRMSRSRSSQPRYCDDYRDEDYRNRSRSRSRCDSGMYSGQKINNCPQSKSRNVSPDYHQDCALGSNDDGQCRSQSQSFDRHSLSPERSPSTPVDGGDGLDECSDDEPSLDRSDSFGIGIADSRNPSPVRDDSLDEQS